MKLSDLIYKIEGELPEGESLQTTDVDVLIVTKDGRRFEPEATACDGELMIINGKETSI